MTNERQTNLDHWDLWYLGLAKNMAKGSKDPSTGVGCVMADSRHRFRSAGFNGFPAGINDSDERLENRETKLQLTMHAEMNALLFASSSLDGCTAYVWPLPPCVRCCVALIQAGISRVVAPELPVTHERWAENTDLAYQLYQEAGVITDFEKLPEEYDEEGEDNPEPTVHQALAAAEAALRRGIRTRGGVMHSKDLMQYAEKISSWRIKLVL